MLAHWIKKDHWLANGVNCRLKKELWDGKRWSELEWFWNPDSTWTLPTCCVHCDIPYLQTISLTHKLKIKMGIAM